MKNLLSLALVPLLALLFVPVPAYAEGGFAIGGSFGTASLSEDFDGLGVDTDSTAFRLTVGWQFNEYVALEAGYHNFGRFKQTVDMAGAPVEIRLKADGFTLGANGTLPLGDSFALVGRAGAFFWDGDADINGISQARPEDTNLFLGAGLAWHLTGKLDVIGDWTRYELEDTESDVVSLGLRYTF